MGHVKHIQVYEDASGAPAVVTHGRCVFACDTLGELRMRLLAPAYSSRRERKIASEMCEKAYLLERGKLVDAEWLARNALLYAVKTS